MANPLLCRLEEKQAREISNQGHVVEYLAEFVKLGRNRITESYFLEMHRLTIEGIYPCAGHYRDAHTHIEITDTDHKPVHPSQVRSSVCDMLEWLNGAARQTSPVHRAFRSVEGECNSPV